MSRKFLSICNTRLVIEKSFRWICKTSPKEAQVTIIRLQRILQLETYSTNKGANIG